MSNRSRHRRVVTNLTVHTCQTFAQVGFERRLKGPHGFPSVLCFVRAAERLACLAIPSCTLLEVLDLLAQPPKLKKSPGKVVRRYGWFWCPNPRRDLEETI
jgi:hypothetical protein